MKSVTKSWVIGLLGGGVVAGSMQVAARLVALPIGEAGYPLLGLASFVALTGAAVYGVVRAVTALTPKDVGGLGLLDEPSKATEEDNEPTATLPAEALREMCDRASRGERFPRRELEGLNVNELLAIAKSYPPPSPEERKRRSERARAMLELMDAQSFSERSN